MPSFALDAGWMAAGLAAQHGLPPISPPAAPPDPELAAIGADLVGRGTGFSCTTCHDRGDEKATAFDAQGPDLLSIPGRLRRDFYRRFMDCPQRWIPGTLDAVFSWHHCISKTED